MYPGHFLFITFVLINLPRNASFNYKQAAHACFRARARSDWAEYFFGWPNFVPFLTFVLKEERKRKIMPLIVATYVCRASRLQRRMGSTRTLLGPITIIVATTLAQRTAAHALHSDQNEQSYIGLYRTQGCVHKCCPLFCL